MKEDKIICEILQVFLASVIFCFVSMIICDIVNLISVMFTK